jgi:PAS domain S-box-containing protein
MPETARDTASLAGAIVEQIADAVIFADADGAIRWWNGAAVALFGYSAADALGQRLDLIIPERLRAAHWRGFDAAMASGVTKLEGRPTVTRATHQSGRRLYVEMSFALVTDPGDGTVRGAVAVARDVTERVEQQQRAGGA